MFTVKQAAEQLSLSAASVYALCNARILRHERHGVRSGKILIPEDALLEYRHKRSVSEPMTVSHTKPMLTPSSPSLRHIRVSTTSPV